MSVKNYYEILGVSQDASTSEILQAYWHKEDKLRAQGLDSSDPRRVEIKTAYDTLSSVLKRREYDVQFDQQPTSSIHSPELDQARTDLVSILDVASSPPIIGGWQDPPSTDVDSIHNAPVMPDLRSSLHDDQPLLDDPFADITAPPKKKSTTRRARNQQKKSAYDWVSEIQASSPKPKPNVTAQVQTQTAEKSSGNGVALVIVLVLAVTGVLLGIVFAAVESETEPTMSINRNTQNQAIEEDISPTFTPPPAPTRASTSTPNSMNTISRLEVQGDEAFQAEEYSLAVTRYTQAISRNATAELYYKRALAFWMGREYMDDLEVLSAVNDLNNAIAEHEAYSEAIRLRGIIHYELWVAFGIQDDRLQAITDLALYQAMAGGVPDSEIIDMLTALGE